MNTEFVQRCADKAEHNPMDPSVEAWAVRMFSAIAIVGTMPDELSEETRDSLAEAMSRAPVEVVMGGTMNLMALNASKFSGSDDTDPLSGLFN